MAAQGGANVDLFDAYFRRADLDQDGRISGAEAVAFFQGSNLSKQVLAQVYSSFSLSVFIHAFTYILCGLEFIYVYFCSYFFL